MIFLKKHKSKIIFLSLFFIRVVSFAQSLDEPALGQVQGIIITIFYYVVGLAGVVFAGVIGYGAWKFAASFGDPRAVDAAKGTLTNGLIGFGIVVLAFIILRIFATLVGIQNVSMFGLGAILDGLIAAIEELTGLAIRGNEIINELE